MILCSRIKSNGEAAKEKILEEFPDAKINVKELDLSDFVSIRQFAADFLSSRQPLHILINNAGVMMCPKGLTKFGVESQLGVNHVGHFLLTKLLLPALESTGSIIEPSRVVNVSSIAQYVYGHPGGINFDDLNSDKDYDPCIAYGQSKLANVLFTHELQKRLSREGKNVITASLHPGFILGTNLKQHIKFSTLWTATVDLLSKYQALRSVVTQKMKSIPQVNQISYRVRGIIVSDFNSSRCDCIGGRHTSTSCPRS